MALAAARYMWKRTPAWIRRRLTPFVEQAIGNLQYRRLSNAWRRGNEPSPRLAIVGFHSAVLGLGEGARMHAAALARLGIDVECVDVGAMLDPAASRRPASLPSAGTTVISHLNPPELLSYLARTDGDAIRDRRHIGYWAWELPDPPAEWRAAFRFVDEVWVPSRFVARSLARIAPTAVPIRVVPHPVHLSTPGSADRSRFGLPDDKVLVLAAFDLRSTLARKNLDGILAILEGIAAHHAGRIHFVLKVVGVRQEVQAHAVLRRKLRQHRCLHLLEAELPRAEMSDLLASVDIVLSPHRAEGFGLLLAEAMHAGKPVIATGWSGNMDFMSPESSVLLDYMLVPIHDPQQRYAGSHWAEPSVAQAIEAIVALAESPDEREALGERGRRYLHRALGGETWAANIRADRVPRASTAADLR